MKALIALVAVVELGGCRATPANECAGATVLIVTAMQEEMRPVTARARDLGACVVFGGRPARLAIVGVGPALSGRNTLDALAGHETAAVVMVGIAGGISHELHVGDVTVPAQWSRHDIAEHWLPADRGLRAQAAYAHPALRACTDPSVCTAAPHVVLGGNGVSGAWFVAEPSAGAELERRLGAQVTDMETAIVAEVARRRGVPFVAVRAISDLVWTGRSRDLVAQYDELAADNAAAVAEALLRSP